MHTAHRRLPRAGIDRFDRAEPALATIAMAIHHPLRAETIVIALDDDRRGRAVVVVSGTEHPDAVVEVVEFVAGADVRLSALVVASIRPPGSTCTVSTRPPRSDVDRWLEMSELTEQVGVELVEWFVVGRDITCPRDALGEPPRW